MRFEQFMAFFMRYVPWSITKGTYDSRDRQGRESFFDSVEVTQGSWDGGKDVLCKKRGKGHLMLQCKNYANAVSSDLLHTMLSKLQYSHANDREKYVKAVAAVCPHFANPQQVQNITIFGNGRLSDHGMNLSTLEWEPQSRGATGIKKKLRDFIESDDQAESERNTRLVLQYLKDDFPAQYTTC